MFDKAGCHQTGGSSRLRNLIPFRVRIYRTDARRDRGHYTAAAAVALLLPLLWAFPADAATTGSNTATVTLTTSAVVSVSVSPTTSTFGNCTGGNPNELAFPNGTCTVGVSTGNEITGGVTVTNGTSPANIYVNGGNAVPTDNGATWALEWTSNTPGANEFLEANLSGLENPFPITTTASCDEGFTGQATGPCGTLVGAGASTEEALALIGPSSSTDSGPFAITTTWTAVG